MVGAMGSRHFRRDRQQELDIWNKGLAMGREILNLTDGFPNDDLYGLRVQIRRSVSDVTSALEMGQSRSAERESRSHLSRANRLLCEIGRAHV